MVTDVPSQPVTVDRRSQLTHALIHIATTQGLDRASVRTVAAAAGVAIGTVQHYFPTKDDMMVAAFREVVDATSARMASLPCCDTVRETLATSLREFLPLDEERLVEGRVYVAFAARAAVSPSLAEIQTETLAQISDTLEQVLATAVSAGETAKDLDPENEARLLLALADGLTFQAVSAPGRFGPADLSRALDTYLDRLFKHG